MNTKNITTKAAHSPLPWFVTRGNEIGYDGKDANGNRHVGYVAETLRRGEYGRADAELIVRACNNVERLADAHTQILSILKRAYSLVEPTSEIFVDMACIETVARQSLAQLEKK